MIAGRPRYYQRSLIPNWTLRMGATKLVIAPTPPAIPAWDGKVMLPSDARTGRKPPCVFRLRFGTLNCGVLERLKNSARNCSFKRSVIPKFLNIEKSALLNPGPSSMPTTGIAVVAALRHGGVRAAHELKGIGIEPLVDGRIVE